MTEWLNGPGFVRWLEEHCNVSQLEDNRQRTLRHYRAGAQASLASADRILTALGRHLNELPDELWDSNRRNARKPHAVKVSALRALADGTPVGQVAREAGVSTSTIRYWRKRAA